MSQVADLEPRTARCAFKDCVLVAGHIVDDNAAKHWLLQGHPPIPPEDSHYRQYIHQDFDPDYCAMCGGYCAVNAQVKLKK